MTTISGNFATAGSHTISVPSGATNLSLDLLGRGNDATSATGGGGGSRVTGTIPNPTAGDWSVVLSNVSGSQSTVANPTGDPVCYAIANAAYAYTSPETWFSTPTITNGGNPDDPADDDHGSGGGSSAGSVGHDGNNSVGQTGGGAPIGGFAGGDGAAFNGDGQNGKGPGAGGGARSGNGSGNEGLGIVGTLDYSYEVTGTAPAIDASGVGLGLGIGLGI